MATTVVAVGLVLIIGMVFLSDRRTLEGPIETDKLSEVTSSASQSEAADENRISARKKTASVRVPTFNTSASSLTIAVSVQLAEVLDTVTNDIFYVRSFALPE